MRGLARDFTASGHGMMQSARRRRHQDESPRRIPRASDDGQVPNSPGSMCLPLLTMVMVPRRSVRRKGMLFLRKTEMVSEWGWP